MGIFRIIQASPEGEIKRDFRMRNFIFDQCGSTFVCRLLNARESAANAVASNVFALSKTKVLVGTEAGAASIGGFVPMGFTSTVGPIAGTGFGNSSEWAKFNEYDAILDPTPERPTATSGQGAPASGTLPLEFVLPGSTVVSQIRAASGNAGLFPYAWRAVEPVTLRSVAFGAPGLFSTQAVENGNAINFMWVAGANFPAPVTMGIDDVLLINYLIMMRQKVRTA